MSSPRAVLVILVGILATGCGADGTPPTRVRVDLTRTGETRVNYRTPRVGGELLAYLVIEDGAGASRPAAGLIEDPALSLRVSVREDARDHLVAQRTYDRSNIQYGNWELPHTSLVLPRPGDGMRAGRAYVVTFEVLSPTSAHTPHSTTLVLTRPAK